MKKLLQLRQEDNEERKRKTQQGDTDLTWKNLSNKERKKPRAPASETSLYRGVFTNAGDFTDATHPNRRLTRGLYICGNLVLRRSVPKPPATGLAPFIRSWPILCRIWINI